VRVSLGILFFGARFRVLAHGAKFALQNLSTIQVPAVPAQGGVALRGGLIDARPNPGYR
jgi:hypothetical protein